MIDRITEVQDTIDRFSLSPFEALRGLRNAVAPESTQKKSGVTSNSATFLSIDMMDPDYDAFLLSYHREEPYAVEFVVANGGNPPQSKDDYAKLLSKHKMEKDISLVYKLAADIMTTSARINELVSALPGMNRKKEDQFK